MGPRGPTCNRRALEGAPASGPAGQPRGAAEAIELDVVVVAPPLGSVLAGTVVVLDDVEEDDDGVVVSVDDVVPVVFFVDALPALGRVVVVVVVVEPATGAPSTCWAEVIACCMAWTSVWNPARSPAFRAASAFV